MRNRNLVRGFLVATIISDISRTFSEFLLLPSLTPANITPADISLKTLISRTSDPKNGSGFKMNIPIVASSMQAVSGEALSIALSKMGGMSFVYCSQSIESQSAMIKKIKDHKSGFVRSDSNITPESTLREAMALTKKTGHSTIAVTSDGSATGKLLGVLTDKDFWEFDDNLEGFVKDHMTPMSDLVYGHEGISLHEANVILKNNKKECLPIINQNDHLCSLVFKKDYTDHQKNPLELLDNNKRLVAAAGVNTHDYKERIPALVAAGVDVICFDSSDGFSEFQKDAALWARKKYGSSLIIGGGNVVDERGFNYLAKEALLDFVKVGIGGGSICITRQQKGIGRGQASAVMSVAQARDEYYQESGVYVPICSDGGISNDTEVILALAMGANFVMLGKYFAGTDESPSEKVNIGGRIYKPYWGEGSERAKNWQRYSSAGDKIAGDVGARQFPEGVDGYINATGSVNTVLSLTLSKLRSTLVNCGAVDLNQFYETAVLTRISEQTFVESGTSGIKIPDNV